jgi:hypothetical protein
MPKESTLDALQPGMKVKVAFARSGAAEMIIVLSSPPPARVWPTTAPTANVQRIGGILVKIDGPRLTIQSHQNESDGMELQRFAITTDDSTEFQIDVFAASLRDLNLGMDLNCIAQGPSGSHRRRLIIFAHSPDSLSGTIMSISGRTIVVKATRPGIGQRTVITDDQTKIMFVTVSASGSRPRYVHSTPGRLDDLKPGMHVSVSPGTGTAARIIEDNLPNGPTSRPDQ